MEVADFYAHSSYSHFGKKTNGELELFEISMLENLDVSYDVDDFDLNRFSKNTSLHNENMNYKKFWAKKRIISGRYSQPGDSDGFYKGEKSFPSELIKKPDFKFRASLPHHDEIAVDTPEKPNGHILYSNKTIFKEQFNFRANAAVKHIRKLAIEWKEKHKV